MYNLSSSLICHCIRGDYCFAISCLYHWICAVRTVGENRVKKGQISFVPLGVIFGQWPIYCEIQQVDLTSIHVAMCGIFLFYSVRIPCSKGTNSLGLQLSLLILIQTTFYCVCVKEEVHHYHPSIWTCVESPHFKNSSDQMILASSIRFFQFLLI